MYVCVCIYNIIPESVYFCVRHTSHKTTHFLKLDLTFNGFHHQQTLIT